MVDYNDPSTYTKNKDGFNFLSQRDKKFVAESKSQPDRIEEHYQKSYKEARYNSVVSQSGVTERLYTDLTFFNNDLEMKMYRKLTVKQLAKALAEISNYFSGTVTMDSGYLDLCELIILNLPSMSTPKGSVFNFALTTLPTVWGYSMSEAEFEKLTGEVNTVVSGKAMKVAITKENVWNQIEAANLTGISDITDAQIVDAWKRVKETLAEMARYDDWKDMDSKKLFSEAYYLSVVLTMYAMGSLRCLVKDAAQFQTSCATRFRIAVHVLSGSSSLLSGNLVLASNFFRNLETVIHGNRKMVKQLAAIIIFRDWNHGMGCGVIAPLDHFDDIGVLNASLLIQIRFHGHGMLKAMNDLAKIAKVPIDRISGFFMIEPYIFPVMKVCEAIGDCMKSYTLEGLREGMVEKNKDTIWLDTAKANHPVAYHGFVAIESMIAAFGRYFDQMCLGQFRADNSALLYRSLADIISHLDATNDIKNSAAYQKLRNSHKGSAERALLAWIAVFEDLRNAAIPEKLKDKENAMARTLQAMCVNKEYYEESKAKYESNMLSEKIEKIKMPEVHQVVTLSRPQTLQSNPFDIIQPRLAAPGIHMQTRVDDQLGSIAQSLVDKGEMERRDRLMRTIPAGYVHTTPKKNVPEDVHYKTTVDNPPTPRVAGDDIIDWQPHVEGSPTDTEEEAYDDISNL